MWVPSPRWAPAHCRQMKTPVLMEAQLARAAPPPPTQSAQYRFSGRSSSCFSSASCFLFISIVTPLVSPAFLESTCLFNWAGVHVRQPQSWCRENAINEHVSCWKAQTDSDWLRLDRHYWGKMSSHQRENLNLNSNLQISFVSLACSIATSIVS